MKKRVKTVDLCGRKDAMTTDNTVPSVQTEMKMCPRCNEVKAVSEFYGKEYRCKSCSAAKTRKWNRENRERFNENKRNSHHRNKTSDHAATVRSKYSVQRQKIRDEVFAVYGSSCACCGEENRLFLTIDHEANDGAEHRRAIWGKSRNGSGSALYAWLKKNQFPEGFQVLCYNCNCGKQRNNGLCPHLSHEGVTAIPKGSTLKRGEVRADLLRGLCFDEEVNEMVSSAARVAAVYTM